MKPIFLAVIVAAVIVMLVARVVYGVFDFIEDITGMPGKQYRQHERQHND